MLSKRPFGLFVCVGMMLLFTLLISLSATATEPVGIDSPASDDKSLSMLRVAVDGDGAGVVTPPMGVYMYNQGAHVWLTATARMSSTFDGWSGAISSTTDPISLTMDADKSVTATFTLKQHTLCIAVDGSGMGVVTPTAGLHTYPYGTPVSLQARAGTGSHFVGWSGAVESPTSPITITMDGDKAVTATFELNTYTLTLTLVGNGVVTPTAGLHTYPYGTPVSLQARAGTGSRFVGWSGAVESPTSPITVTMDGDKAVTATFELNTYTLTLTLVGNGVVTPTAGLHTYPYGTPVSLQARAGTGSRFVGWSGAVESPTSPITVTMDGDKAVTATFELNTYTLTLTLVGNGVVTPTAGLHTYPYGTPVSLQARAGTGSRFVGWSGAVESPTSPITVTMDGDKAVTATFKSNTVYLPVVARGFPYAPDEKYVRIVTNGLEYTYQSMVTLEVSATLEGDYVQWVLLSNDRQDWTQKPYAPTVDWDLGSTNGQVTVYARFRGRLGGLSGVVSDTILLFNNGDFAQPNLADWTQNGALRTLAAFDPENPTNAVGLLGDPAYGCTGVPVGFGSLSQVFDMPAVPNGKQLVLKLRYHIYSYDRNIGLTDRYDRFDVLLGGELVHKDANEGEFEGCNALQDVGSKDIELVVTGTPGQQFTLDLRVYNRPDSLYNTWVYVDDVHLEFK